MFANIIIASISMRLKLCYTNLISKHPTMFLYHADRDSKSVNKCKEIIENFDYKSVLNKVGGFYKKEIIIVVPKNTNLVYIK
ncbi:MAG: hypothetical protein COB15_05940 [Flavobacteriales bacterium]|nr:MAG: hypothetical protein COB15_05940 [Flavobacteriales bacterium]